MARQRMLWLASVVMAVMALTVGIGVDPASAEKKYDPGASDTEIKVGNIMPYSGPLSAYALIGRTEAAFFNMINDQGGNQRPQDQFHFL